MQPERYDEQRLWTIMVLIFDTGLRISEVIGLRKDAIDMAAHLGNRALSGGYKMADFGPYIPDR